MHATILDACKSAGIAPSIIGLDRKSLVNPTEEDRCISSAVQAHRGCDFPLPVIFGRKIIGVIEGRRQPDPRVTFRRVPEYVWRCGFNTYDQLIAALTAGQSLPCNFTKTHTTAPTAANYYDLWPLGGSPAAGTFTGSAFTARQLDDTSVGSLYTGGNVSTMTKHVLSVWVQSSGGTPSLTIYDRVLTYEACTYNASVNQAMTNGSAALRYVSAGQSGMKIMVCVQTVNGATAANLTQLRYTNQAGTTLQTMPTSPTVAFVASAAAPTTVIGARSVAPFTSTTAWGPYLPFAVGDSGCRLINDYTTSAANTGQITFILQRPLFSIGTATAGVISQIDGVYQIASLERIFDGACVALSAYYPAGTATTWNGSLQVGWG